MAAAAAPPAPGPRPRTVVHLITTLTQGGAERVLSEVVPRPGEVGEDGAAERHVVVSLAPGGMFADVLRERGVEVRDLGMRPGRDLVRGVRGLRALLREVAATDIIAWMYHACLVATLATAVLPPCGGREPSRVTWFLQSALADPGSLSWHARIVIRLLATISGTQPTIASNSQAGIDDHAAAGFSPSSWRLVPNGCDTDRFRPDQHQRRRSRQELGVTADVAVVGFVGRNHPEKGFDRVLGAMDLLASENVHLVAVGAGTETTDHPRTTGLGVQDDVERLLVAFDVFVLPSRTEGIPNALLEAMAVGLPVVVTDVGDCRTIVGDAGVVIPRDADAGALADAIRRTLRMGSDERERLGGRARDRILAAYDLTRARAAYRGLWQETNRGRDDRA